ncbi:hypothetical protein LBMAG42_01880 [Deltaproteobacteria bacterium]|nr:hypothetical protein LBMAG42_01880 [Deltaproteobacteria bacterium]
MSNEKNASEEEYFVRIEREERARAAAEAEKAKGEAARAELKALHHQRCGKCGGELKPQDFRGVEIDICESCGSVLLDPGELEQLAGKDASGALAGLASLFRFKR